MSINSYLIEQQSNLYVNGVERDKIKTSIDAISQRLDWYFGKDKTNEHKIVKKEIFGSYSRDTMLSRKYDENSDIDFMVIFEDANEYNPQTCLNWLKDFAETYYQSSIVRQSLPTIVIELQNIKFELVPAYELWGMKNVALTQSEWQYTNPNELKDKMQDLNVKTDYRFKRMIRSIKYWNVNKNLRKYESYDLENYLTNSFTYSYSRCKNPIDYIELAFNYLKTKYIDEYVKKRIDKACSNIIEARNLELVGKYDEAENKIKSIFE